MHKIFVVENRLILAVAFSLLIVGAVGNAQKKSSCGILHDRFLSVGGILCFLHGLFTIAFYVSASAAAREAKSPPHVTTPAA